MFRKNNFVYKLVQIPSKNIIKFQKNNLNHYSLLKYIILSEYEHKMSRTILCLNMFKLFSVLQGSLY